MDIIAHTLWTNAVFHFKYHRQRIMRYWAAFFGVVPDFIGFTPLFVYLLVSGKFFSGDRFPFQDQSHWTFAFAENAYNYTHSLVIFFIGTFVVNLIYNAFRYRNNPLNFQFAFFWPIFGWALHILIDIPTHPDFYRTPFLFPLSNYRFEHGISWGHPIFMAINYSLLILVYIGLYLYERIKYKKVESNK